MFGKVPTPKVPRTIGTRKTTGAKPPVSTKKSAYGPKPGQYGKQLNVPFPNRKKRGPSVPRQKPVAPRNKPTRRRMIP